MIGTLTDSRRVTIPREVFDQSNLPVGIKVDITFDGTRFIIEPLLEADKNREVKKDFFVEKHKIETKKKSNNPEGKRREIVSNLEQGLKYKKQYFSECGLVIRTKNKYLKDFCKDCKGKLVDDYGVDYKKCCNYCGNRNKKQEVSTPKKSTKDELIKAITQNAAKINKKIDKKIKDVELDDSTVLEPVKYEDYQSCCNCRTLTQSGFLLNGMFHCKSCAVDDFKKYFIKKKGMIKKCLNQ